MPSTLQTRSSIDSRRASFAFNNNNNKNNNNNMFPFPHHPTSISLEAVPRHLPIHYRQGLTEGSGGVVGWGSGGAWGAYVNQKDPHDTPVIVRHVSWGKSIFQTIFRTASPPDFEPLQVRSRCGGRAGTESHHTNTPGPAHIGGGEHPIYFTILGETGCEALPVTTWGGRRGAAAAPVSRGTTVPLLPTENTFPRWLGTSVFPPKTTNPWDADVRSKSLPSKAQDEHTTDERTVAPFSATERIPQPNYDSRLIIAA